VSDIGGWTRGQRLRLQKDLRVFARAHPQFLKIVTVALMTLLWLAVLIMRTDYVGTANSLDPSWQISLAHLLQQGEISGRDFHFTYGPAAQALTWIGVRLTRSQNAFDAYAMIVLVWCAMSPVLLGAGFLLLRELEAAETAVAYTGAALLNLFTPGSSFRAASFFVYAVLIYRAAAARTPWGRAGWAVATGLFALFMQLVTFELGVYAVLIQIGFVAVMTVFGLHGPPSPDPLPPKAALPLKGGVMAVLANRFLPLRGGEPPKAAGGQIGILREDHLSTAAIACVVLLAGNLVLSGSFMLSSADSPGFFDYQRYAWETMRGYTLTMGLNWELSRLATAGLLFVLGYTVLQTAACWRGLSGSRRALFAAFLVSALVSIRSAMTRSDGGHIALSLTPAILVFLLLWKDWAAFPQPTTSRTPRRLPARAVWCAVFGVLCVAWPDSNLHVFKDAWTVVSGQTSLGESLGRVVSYSYAPEEFLPPGIRKAGLMADRSTPLASFPYDNYIAILLRRPLVAPVVQAYSAATPELQRFYVDRLESRRRNKGLQVVYALDDVSAWAVDGVQAITRGPIIFEYFYRGFEPASPTETDGYYVLRPRMTPRALAVDSLSFDAVHRTPASIEIQLKQTSRCGLLRLDVFTEYKIPPSLSRPAGLRILVTSGGQRVEAIRQINIRSPEPGGWFSTYVSFMAPKQFYRVFLDGPLESAPWSGFLIEPWETDWIGITPRRVEVRNLQCVRGS